MMPAKLWCDHAEGFESGLESLGAGCQRMGTRFWNCVGRCSQVHSDDEYGTEFSQEQIAVTPTVPLFEQLCCNGVTLSEPLERIRPCQLEMERAQMMTGCKSTLSGKARGELYRHQHVQELWQNWTLGEGLLETGWRTKRQFHQ